MLERAVGGAAQLNQLLDKDGDGRADSALVDDCLDRAEADANSLISQAVDVNDPALQSSPFLIQCQVALAKFLAYHYGTSGQAVPVDVMADRDDAERKLQDVGLRRRGLGLSTRPATSQMVQQVTKPAGESWFSAAGPRDRFKGWA